MHRGTRGAAAPQADNVETIERSNLALGEPERNDIGGHAAETSHHDALAEPHKLMDRRVAAKERVVADADMTAEHRVVGERNVVADVAIMRDMRSDHKKATL